MMTTVREARIEAALKALKADGWGRTIVESDLEDMAANVVDALFTPDPHLDNVQVPTSKEGSVVVSDPPKTVPPLVALTQVPKYLGIDLSEYKVLSLVESGDLKKVNIGRRVLITGDSIVAFLNKVMTS